MLSSCCLLSLARDLLLMARGPRGHGEGQRRERTRTIKRFDCHRGQQSRREPSSFRPSPLSSFHPSIHPFTPFHLFLPSSPSSFFLPPPAKLPPGLTLASLLFLLDLPSFYPSLPLTFSLLHAHSLSLIATVIYSPVLFALQALDIHALCIALPCLLHSMSRPHRPTDRPTD